MVTTEQLGNQVEDFCLLCILQVNRCGRVTVTSFYCTMANDVRFALLALILFFHNGDYDSYGFRLHYRSRFHDSLQRVSHCLSIESSIRTATPARSVRTRSGAAHMIKSSRMIISLTLCYAADILRVKQEKNIPTSRAIGLHICHMAHISTDFELPCVQGHRSAGGCQDVST